MYAKFSRIFWEPLLCGMLFFLCNSTCSAVGPTEEVKTSERILNIAAERLTSSVQEKLFAKVRNEFEPCEKQAFTVAEATKLPQLERLAPIFRWMCSGEKIDEVKEMVQIELKKIDSSVLTGKNIFSLPENVSGKIFAEVVELNVPAPKGGTPIRDYVELLQAIVEIIKVSPGLQVFELFKLNSEDKEKLHLKILNLTWDKVEEEKNSHLQVLNLEEFGLWDSNEPLFFDVKSNFLAEVTRATNLKSFNWSGNRLLATEIQDALMNKAKLEVLCLTINEGDIFYADKFSKIIESAKNLKVLKVNGSCTYSHLAEDVGRELSKFKPKLEMLWLQLETIHLTKEFVEAIGQMEILRILRLEQIDWLEFLNTFTSNGHEVLAKAIVANKNLEYLILAGNENLEQYILAFFRPLLLFEEKRHIEPFFKEIFGKSRNLKFLRLTRYPTIVPNLEEEDIKTENLEVLELRYGFLGNESLGTIEKIMDKSAMWLLNLSDNSIDWKALDKLRQILEKDKLVMLSLEHNSLGLGACDLMESLPQNLSVLNLSRNKLTLCEELKDILKGNEVLRCLYLDGNNIRLGVGSIAEGLKFNKALTTLGLSNTRVTDREAKQLAEALKLNKSLVNLDLSRNKVTELGALELWEALQYNETLVALDLQDNKSTDGSKLESIDARRLKQQIDEMKQIVDALPLGEIFDTVDGLEFEPAKKRSRPGLEVDTGLP